jgi:hypothetical protein
MVFPPSDGLSQVLVAVIIPPEATKRNNAVFAWGNVMREGRPNCFQNYTKAKESDAIPEVLVRRPTKKAVPKHCFFALNVIKGV